MKKILTLLCLLVAGATFASDDNPQAKGKEGICSGALQTLSHDFIGAQCSQSLQS